MCHMSDVCLGIVLALYGPTIQSWKSEHQGTLADSRLTAHQENWRCTNPHLVKAVGFDIGGQTSPRLEASEYTPHAFPPTSSRSEKVLVPQSFNLFTQ